MSINPVFALAVGLMEIGSDLENVARETGDLLVGGEIMIDIEVELIRQKDQPTPVKAAAAS